MDMDSRLQKIKNTIEISGGGKRVDLLLRNARVINTFSGDIHRTHVAVHNGRVVGFGDYKAAKVMDLKDAYVSPGFIETELLGDIPAEQLKEYKSMIPARRFGTTGEVAHAVLFLCGRKAGYITGSVLEVTGGL